jgi:hypothetical protein
VRERQRGERERRKREERERGVRERREGEREREERDVFEILYVQAGNVFISTAQQVADVAGVAGVDDDVHTHIHTHTHTHTHTTHIKTPRPTLHGHQSHPPARPPSSQPTRRLPLLLLLSLLPLPLLPLLLLPRHSPARQDHPEKVAISVREFAHGLYRGRGPYPCPQFVPASWPDAKILPDVQK